MKSFFNIPPLLSIKEVETRPGLIKSEIRGWTPDISLIIALSARNDNNLLMILKTAIKLCEEKGGFIDELNIQLQKFSDIKNAGKDM